MSDAATPADNVGTEPADAGSNTAEAADARANEAPSTRAIVVSIEVDAPRDRVWRTMTDPEFVSRWFAPIASGETGEGGHLTVSWGPGADWTTWIHEWDPPRRVLYSSTKAGDENREQTEEEVEQAASMTTTYRLEERDGGTLVELVNGGWSTDPSWDAAFHMTANGWRFFLWNIKHIVERHHGTPRTMISDRPWVSGTREEVWDKIFGPDGVPSEAGETFRLRLGADGAEEGGDDSAARDDDTPGVVLEGVTVLSDRPWAFAGMVTSLDDGIVHVEMEGMGGDRWKIGVWISAYGVEEEQCDRIRTALDETIARLFPDQG